MTHTYDINNASNDLPMSPSVTHENAQNERDAIGSDCHEAATIVPRAPIAPAPPIVAGKLLRGPQIDFIDFIRNEECRQYCVLLFGEHATSAATMVSEFRKGAEFNYFGPRTSRTPWNAGKLDRLNSANKRLLTEFAERAYRGDSEGRDIRYWKAIARYVWQAYADLMAQRARGEKIRQREINRQAALARKRAAAAERAKRYRARQRVKSSPQSDDERVPIACAGAICGRCSTPDTCITPS